MEKCYREITEEIEEKILSPYATLSSKTRGRDEYQAPCPIRTEFQRDRDRIIHCKAYRRLMHKTQVFLSPEGDHYRTRLTHTNEVTQVARTMARALRLNEDLTEAIALGHDLGHTPFGHAGEEALNDVYPGGFRHSVQSVRVVEKIEKLNLTWEVRNGILCHSNGKDAETREGQIVRFADKIAYINHDIEDAQRAGVLSEDDIPYNVKYALGRTKSERLTTLITSVIENSGEEIKMSPDIYKAFIDFKSFMFKSVYANPNAKSQETKAKDILKKMYDYFVHNVDKLPKEYLDIVLKDGKERAVCDYISGMSDRYDIALFEDLFVPKPWGFDFK